MTNLQQNATISIMAIKFYRLFDLINRKKIKKSELRSLANLSGKTIAKLSANENVNIEVINRLCKALSCQPADIMEYEAED